MSNISKLPLMHLELYTLLVYYGIKDAYLVDCCCMDEIQAKTFMQHMKSKYTLKSELVLIVILDNEVLFANHKSLVEKINSLEQRKNIPVVVDLNEELCVMTDADVQMDYIINIFSACLHTDALLDTFTVQVTEELHTVVGLPFIAGWLLGYPCLYRAQMQREAADLTEDSSMINLLKLSICATVRVHVEVKNETIKKGQNMKGIVVKPAPTSTPYTGTVEIVGFSIPEKLWNSCLEVRVKLQASLDAIAVEMQNQADHLNSAAACLAVTDIKAEQNVHTVPKIAL